MLQLLVAEFLADVFELRNGREQEEVAHVAHEHAQQENHRVAQRREQEEELVAPLKVQVQRHGRAGFADAARERRVLGALEDLMERQREARDRERVENDAPRDLTDEKVRGREHGDRPRPRCEHQLHQPNDRRLRTVSAVAEGGGREHRHGASDVNRLVVHKVGGCETDQYERVVHERPTHHLGLREQAVNGAADEQMNTDALDDDLVLFVRVGLARLQRLKDAVEVAVDRIDVRQHLHEHHDGQRTQRIDIEERHAVGRGRAQQTDRDEYGARRGEQCARTDGRELPNRTGHA